MRYLLFIFLLAACNTANETTRDSLSSASFGTVTHRIQFNPDAGRMKYSPNASGFDDTSGATYRLDAEDGATLTYFDEDNAETVLTAVVVSSDEVKTSIDGTDEQTFTPKASNLGARPE